MITFISTFLRHYVFCLLGALVRFLWDLVMNKFKKRPQVIKFKDYRNYSENPDTEMIDAIIGFIIFGAIIGVFIRVTNRHGW